MTVQGVLGRVLAPIRQLFEQIEVSSAAADADARFQQFKSQIWPRIKEAGNSGDHLIGQNEGPLALFLALPVLCSEWEPKVGLQDVNSK